MTNGHIPAAQPAVRVLLVEDHLSVRESLRLMLETQRDLQVVGEVGDGRAAVAAVASLSPDVVLLDLSMPDVNGLEAAKEIGRLCPRTRICVLTRHNDHAHFLELIRAGVLGYVLKQSRTAELLAAIRTVAAGGEYVDDAMTSRMTQGYRGDAIRTASTLKPLSNREEAVVRQTAWGRSNKEIAQAMHLSVKTIEAHKSNAMRKLGCNSRLDIVRYAVLKGWLQDPDPI
jgi:DNA-binding NarL/FixJ family response regulator